MARPGSCRGDPAVALTGSCRGDPAAAPTPARIRAPGESAPDRHGLARGDPAHPDPTAGPGPPAGGRSPGPGARLHAAPGDRRPAGPSEPHEDRGRAGPLPMYPPGGPRCGTSTQRFERGKRAPTGHGMAARPGAGRAAHHAGATLPPAPPVRPHSIPAVATAALTPPPLPRPRRRPAAGPKREGA